MFYWVMQSVVVLINFRDETKQLPEIIRPLVDDVQGQELTVVVNRCAVLKSVKVAVMRTGFSFNRPIKIVFSGEDAVDEGGPRREFFRQVSVEKHLFTFVTLNECNVMHLFL